EDYVRSYETIQRAAFERRPGRVGPEMFVGSYIGPRLRNGQLIDQTCVVALVRQKVRDKARICESCRLDELKDQIGADIVVCPVGRTGTTDWTVEIPDGLMYTEEKPIKCGATIGPYSGTSPTGTLGALVLGHDNKLYILSNNHVLAGVSGIIDGVYPVGLP